MDLLFYWPGHCERIPIRNRGVRWDEVGVSELSCAKRRSCQMFRGWVEIRKVSRKIK